MTEAQKDIKRKRRVTFGAKDAQCFIGSAEANILPVIRTCDILSENVEYNQKLTFFKRVSLNEVLKWLTGKNQRPTKKKSRAILYDY